MEYRMKGTIPLVACLVLGFAIFATLGKLGFTALATLWPAYAAADPDKTFSIAMLLSRLSVGALSTAGAACIATIVAADNGRAAWWLGWIFVVISLPVHLYFVWSDYPVWYHVVYLSYLVPIAVLTGRFFRSMRSSLPHDHPPVTP
jgi:hypothetical protein